ncbi:MAG: Lpg1974 family pore-forming outer membrane protein, partial [Thiotrichales bacterium]|nr:Lpg1974 family pore-forming outer membrane protein [Thiotrichales bacterium]
ILDAIWNVNNSGFGIFGNVGGSLLYGENDFTYFAEDVDPADDDIVSFDSEEKHIFSVLEASVGAKYSNIINNVNYNLRLGYEFETWLDSFSSVTFVDDTTDELFTREDTDLSLHGLFFRAQVIW